MVFDASTILSRVLHVLGVTEFFGDDDMRYNSFRIAYESKRRALLSMHYWGFATSFLLLNRSVITPQMFFTQAHDLPADFMKVVYLNGSNLQGVDEGPYQLVEGNMVYSNFPEVYLCYTKNVFDVNRFSPLFLEALVYSVAMELCMPLGQDKEHLDRITALYKDLEFESINKEHRDQGDRNQLVDRTIEHSRTGLDGGGGEASFNLSWPPVTIESTPFEGRPVNDGTN